MKYRSRSDIVGLLLDAANGVGQTYRTTEKGMRLLHLQNKIDEVAPVSFIKE